MTCVITFLGLVVKMKKVNNNPWFVFSTSVFRLELFFLVGEEHFYFGADVVDNPYPRLNFETILPANYEFISHKKKLK